MTDTHKGGCHCGRTRYTFTGPLTNIAHCHCSICRKTSGGTVVTWITVDRSAFAWTLEPPAEYASSSTCTRYFCPGCGAQMALFTTLAPATMDVTIGSLDHPEAASPERHIWIDSRLPWLQLDTHLPEERQESL